MLKIITIIAVMLCPVLALTDSEPFTILGFEIPSIENENWLLETDRVPTYSFHLTVEMLFFVSDSGAVDSIQFTSEKDSLYLKNIWNSLSNIRFYPARFNGKAIPFIVPAKIRFENRYGRSNMSLEFPFQEPDCSVIKMALLIVLE